VLEVLGGPEAHGGGASRFCTGCGERDARAGNDRRRPDRRGYRMLAREVLRLKSLLGGGACRTAAGVSPPRRPRRLSRENRRGQADAGRIPPGASYAARGAGQRPGTNGGYVPPPTLPLGPPQPDRNRDGFPRGSGLTTLTGAYTRPIPVHRRAGEHPGPPGTMVVNGYEVMEAPNGAWWVRRPDRPRQAWRFATRHEALRFAQGLHPPTTPAGGPTPLRVADGRDGRKRA
jgi:hypothetical protein